MLISSLFSLVSRASTISLYSRIKFRILPSSACHTSSPRYATRRQFPHRDMLVVAFFSSVKINNVPYTNVIISHCRCSVAYVNQWQWTKTKQKQKQKTHYPILLSNCTDESALPTCPWHGMPQKPFPFASGQAWKTGPECPTASLEEENGFYGYFWSGSAIDWPAWAAPTLSYRMCVLTNSSLSFCLLLA